VHILYRMVHIENKTKEELLILLKDKKISNCKECVINIEKRLEELDGI